MKILGNPIMLRMGLGLLAAIFAFVMGLLMMRRMRRSIMEEASLVEGPTTPERFPLHTYHAVIQQLKQQKHELLSEQQIERRRAKASENISAAVLSNLSCGVVFFTPNGLIRQANGAAKHILGFASLAGMNAAQVFGNATLLSASGSHANMAQAIQASLREKTPARQLALRYVTPGTEERILEIIVTSVHSPAGEILGAACLINDQTEVTQVRRQQELRGEMSAEMALELRNSLATISGYAQQLAASGDAELAQQLAADIAAEAAHLDQTIGGFLIGPRAEKVEQLRGV
jgi:nitrogen fixation/metabolism regulation signal transduction histidine kinase